MTVRSGRRPSAGALLTVAVYAFLYAPLIVLVAFSFNRARLAARWEGFTLEWYAVALRDQRVLAALRNSVIIALATTVLATAVGTAAALAFHRLRLRAQGTWDALVVVPLVLPEIVLAASLVLLFAAMGMRLGFFTVVLAHVAFSLSYAIVVVRARLAGFDRSLEEAAMDLGASPLRTLRHVTLPLIAPGILAAALLVFAVSIDDPPGAWSRAAGPARSRCRWVSASPCWARRSCSRPFPSPALTGSSTSTSGRTTSRRRPCAASSSAITCA